jgi:N-acetylmuramoyl-L-alanine amidase
LGSCAIPCSGGAELIREPTVILSPNCGPRRQEARPDIVVIHYTAMRSLSDALDRLTDPSAEVSAHYLVGEDGAVYALVPEDLRAWHAGAGQWGDVTDVNSRSIGIELANPGNAPFAARQMQATETLLTGIMSRWSIRPERVIGHSDMAPARKLDPGPRFDWRRLARGGRSVWPGTLPLLPAGKSVDATGFVRDLRLFGYRAPVADDVLLGVFRLRFRPWATGPLDQVDVALARDLAQRFPVDPAGAGA